MKKHFVSSDTVRNAEASFSGSHHRGNPRKKAPPPDRQSALRAYMFVSHQCQENRFLDTPKRICLTAKRLLPRIRTAFSSCRASDCGVAGTSLGRCHPSSRIVRAARMLRLCCRMMKQAEEIRFSDCIPRAPSYRACQTARGRGIVPAQWF